MTSCLYLMGIVMKNKIDLPEYCSKFSCKNKLDKDLEDGKQVTTIERIYYFCSPDCRTKAFEDMSKTPYKKI